MNTLLQVRNLSVIHRKTKQKLVNNVNFSLHKSEILGIIGESGSGKTLTCRCILDLLSKKTFDISGEIIFENKNIISLPEEKLNLIRGNKIALIMQNPIVAFDPMTRIGKQMIESIQIHKNLHKNEILSMLEKMLIEFGMKDVHRIFRSFPSQLSGGMLQRLMIILALSLSPDIIIADEATTALDIKTQSTVLDEFKKIKEMGISLIIVTHDFGVIAKLADNVVVMKDGNFIESGTVYDIFDSPKNSYTKELLLSNLLKGGKKNDCCK